MKTRIYLDNCCFNRPFDDQSQIRIRIESEAKLKIQHDIVEEKFELVWSYILEAENLANPFEERVNAILDWKSQAISLIKENKKILDKAKKLKEIGLRSKDALHISCAISAKCKYFLTTDDKILNKNNLIKDINVIDPIGFIKEVYL
jgi:predicted nucleic acid-binding protein